MAGILRALRRIRIVPRRTGTLIKATIACALILSAVTLLTLGASIRDTRARADFLRQRAAKLEQENRRLEEKIDLLGSLDSVRQIAQEQLGLVFPGIIIFEQD